MWFDGTSSHSDAIYSEIVAPSTSTLVEADQNIGLHGDILLSAHLCIMAEGR